ncbi:MAG: PEP-CTERM sorting domain-containing protein [Prosthecobacter sp.]|nr:PEP-CTERM sorting domain-containing protein [Prosthecobacter sp.]
MDYRTAYKRRLFRGSQIKKRLAALAMLGAAACAVLILLLREPELIRSAEAGEAVTAAVVPGAPNPSTPPAAKARPIYRYSIIPGGVSDRDELARVIRTDKVVAAHYASFHVNRAEPLIVSKPRAVYVSYRKGDQVYWTAKKLMLAAGETLFSDGQNEMRGRCANRISDLPQLPTETDGPGEDELNTAFEATASLLEGRALLGTPVGLGQGGTGPSGQPRLLFASTHDANFAPTVATTLSIRDGRQSASGGGFGANSSVLGGQFGPATMESGVFGPGDFAPGSAGETLAGAAPSPVADGSTGEPGGSLTSPGGPDHSALPPADQLPMTDPGSLSPGKLPDAPSVPLPGADQGGEQEGGEREGGKQEGGKEEGGKEEGGKEEGGKEAGGEEDGGEPPPGSSPHYETPLDLPGPGTEEETTALIPGTPLGPPVLPGSSGAEVPKSAEVPEPGTLWLSGAAFAAMLLLRRKARRKMP